MSLCQICQKNAATVHVTEIQSFPVVAPGETTDEEPSFLEKHVCEGCAKRSKVPHSGVVPEDKGMHLLNMLKESARRVRQESALTCPDCGMTFAEFRSKGRLGCPKDYEIFRQQLQPLLLRIHNAAQHVGRVPDQEQRERRDRLTDLREKLDQAVRDEAYESAAALRDEIDQLEKRAE